MERVVVVAGYLRVLREHLDKQFPPPPAGNARAPSPLTLLFERWVTKDSWLLLGEAVPLLLGCDPDLWLTRCADLEILAEVEQLDQELAALAREGTDLPVLNPDAPTHEWRVRPADVYLWTVGLGYRVPEPFATLVQFVLQVVKRPELSRASPGAGASGSEARERVLGAAVALLARTPQACRNDEGFVDPRIIARLLAQQSVRWFESPRPPMPEADIATLVAQWVD